MLKKNLSQRCHAYDDLQRYADVVAMTFEVIFAVLHFLEDVGNRLVLTAFFPSRQSPQISEQPLALVPSAGTFMCQSSRR